MGLPVRGSRLVRKDKNVERTQPEIVSIYDPDLAETLHEFRFKGDDAVKIRHCIGRELQNHLISHTLSACSILPELSGG